MQSFEYANPATLKEAFALLGSNWEDANILAGGTTLADIDLLSTYLVAHDISCFMVAEQL